MRDKTIVCILAAIFFLAVPAYAELPKAVDIVMKMQEKLNLNQDQLSKVKPIIEENITKRQQVTPQLSQGLTQAQSQPLDSELYQKLREILTLSQMSRWNTMSGLMQSEI
jgi:hypothetical protein